MKRWQKVSVGVVAVLGVVLAGFVTYLKHRPIRTSPVWSEPIAPTPERLARGEYLANHVAVCMDCHSTREWSQFSGPPVRGTQGAGGFRLGRESGFPGEIYARNISSDRGHGVGGWSDGELVRAIREGVSRDGSPLFPFMPYPQYRTMSDEDVRSVVVYLRSLAPQSTGPYPAPSLDMPLPLLIRGFPAPAGENGHVAARAPGVDAQYGEYLAGLAGCIDCHTQEDHGQRVAGMDFAGGREFRMPWGVVRTANITPDAETGIGRMSEDDFVARFRMYRPENGDPYVERAANAQPVPGNTIMPWRMFAGMRDDDLRAIYRYLRTVRPVHNTVVRGGAPASV